MSLTFNRRIAWWNTIVVLASIFMAIGIPVDYIPHDKPAVSLVSSWIVTLVFSVDFIIRLVTFSRDEREGERSGAMWYQKAMLVADLLSAIPFGFFVPLPAIKLMRLFKLFRTYDLLKSFLQTRISYAGLFTFFTFLLWFMIAVHWLACGWVMLGQHDVALDFWTNYINALYWTITTLTTVGYGDILPTNNTQKVYAIIVQVLGFGVFGFIIGSVAGRLMRSDPARAKYQENMENLSSLMHYRHLPAPLRDKIVEFYKYMWKKRLGYDETAFLQTLPENLQTRVALYLKKDVINTVSLFKDTSVDFKREIALLLKPVFLTPGDYIFKGGDHGKEMYFVVKGDLHVLSKKEDEILTALHAGDYFGEIALFRDRKRSATVKAITYCDLYALDKLSFDTVLSKYPVIGQKIWEIIEKRQLEYTGEL